MSRQENFPVDLAPGEPAPPQVSGELFAGHEVAAFESFLDNLATDNEYLFHPKVPASLSWNGFHTTKNQGFDEFKHSGLQFGSDKHFSPTNGYIARHKYVPVGYGHVHPQSSAQRSQRSSNSSRSHSRRPSLYMDQASDISAAYSTSPATTRHQHIANHAVDVKEEMLPAQRVHQSDYARAMQEYEHRTQQRRDSVSQQLSPGQQPRSTQQSRFRLPEELESVQSTPRLDMEERISSRTMDVSRADTLRTSPSTERDVVSKKIKIEEGLRVSKQPLTAAQKRQNHISSEQRRRNLIKEGFNDLSAIVPNVVGNASKSTILHEAIAFIKRNGIRNQELRDRIDELRSRKT